MIHIQPQKVVKFLCNIWSSYSNHTKEHYCIQKPLIRAWLQMFVITLVCNNNDEVAYFAPFCDITINYERNNMWCLITHYDIFVTIGFVISVAFVLVIRMSIYIHIDTYYILSHLLHRDITIALKVEFSNSLYRMMAWALTANCSQENATKFD